MTVELHGHSISLFLNFYDQYLNFSRLPTLPMNLRLLLITHANLHFFFFIPQLWTISLKYFICPLTCFEPAHYSITLSFQEFLFESCDKNWRLPTIPKKSIYQSKNINYTLIFMNSKFLDATAKENCFNKSV